jgi:hypothetical protein
MITMATCIAISNFAADIAYLRDKGYDEKVVAQIVLDTTNISSDFGESLQTIVKQTYNNKDLTPEMNANLALKTCEKTK